MSTVVDYVGRSSDMLAYQGDYTRRGDQRLTASLVGDRDGGSLITGIQKLAQWFVLILLTPKGSRQYAPNDGTIFMVEARQGRWRTSADVGQAFYSSRLDAGRQLRAIETVKDPVDERYADAELLQVSLTAGNIVLTVKVTSVAGDSFVYVAPIQVPIR